MKIKQSDLYAGYANASIRAHASSGGIVSAILIDLLNHKVIDGAIVSRISAEQGHIVAQTQVAQTPDEILHHGGSSYIDTPVLQKIRELQHTEGRYAVVMLPCQVRAFEALARQNPHLKTMFSPIIALFCRGTVNPIFYDDYFRRMKIDPGSVETIKVKRRYVRGDVIVYLHNGDQIEIPFININSYRQAGFHAKRLCAWCTEHIGLNADISVGDIFMAEYRDRSIKYSAFTAHSETGCQTLQMLVDSEDITAEHVGWEIYRQRFSKIEAMSNTLASRFQAAQLAGQARPRSIGPDGGKYNFFHMLAWLLIYSNGRLSRSQQGRQLIYLLPTRLIILYTLMIKALSKF